MKGKRFNRYLKLLRRAQTYWASTTTRSSRWTAFDIRRTELRSQAQRFVQTSGRRCLARSRHGLVALATLEPAEAWMVHVNLSAARDATAVRRRAC